MEQKIIEDLTCPITLELFEDPITVPCCGKTFSRKPLHLFLTSKQDKKCPLCNGDLHDFKASAVQTNKNLLSFVELIKNQQIVKQQLERKEQEKEQKEKDRPQQWTLTINKMCSDMQFFCSCGKEFACRENREVHISNATDGVHAPAGEQRISRQDKKDNDGELYIPIAEFRLNLCNSLFQLKASLFIMVVDKSGSMSGNPWSQVQTALIHIIGITKPNKLIKTEIITYASTAHILIHPGTNQIKAMRAGGGTNFNQAFKKINELIQANRNISNVTVCFLTDGQDTSGPTNQALIACFEKMTRNYEKTLPSMHLTVHSIGFSAGCDKKFLEALRTENGGTFRYAEPGDADDELCNKLKSLFQQISRGTNIMLDLKIESKLFSFYQAKNWSCREIAVPFAVNNNGEGCYTQWVVLHDDGNAAGDGYGGCVVLNSSVDRNVEIAVVMDVVHQNRREKMFDQWQTWLIDEIATNIYNLANKQYVDYDADVFDLHCALIQQKLDILQVSTKHKGLLNKIEYLVAEVNKLRDGLTVNIGQLSDQRFGSKFTNLRYATRARELAMKQAKNEEKKADSSPEIVAEILMPYSHNHEGKNRNELQKCILALDVEEAIKMVHNSKDVEKALLHRDIYANNALLTACYCGRYDVVRELLKFYVKMADFDINTMTNDDNETCMTLAIKRCGHWKTVNVLLAHNAIIPVDRSRALEKYAIEHNYVIIAKLIHDQRESCTKNVAEINESMSAQYITFLFNQSIEAHKHSDIDFDKYLILCLKKRMLKMVEVLINKYNVTATIDMLLNYCIPTRYDSKLAQLYLNLAKLLLAHSPNLIIETNENGETALYKACETGNVAHVEYFIKLNKTAIDTPNAFGNTPLYITCVKCPPQTLRNVYPSIIKALIKQKADVNFANLEGNTPMSAICKCGNPNFAEILLSTNVVRVDVVNKNGDSLIIDCCRLGHSKVLELLLNYIDNKGFVYNYESKANGFNALFSCLDFPNFTVTDQTNHEECIKMLYEYGVDLNQTLGIDANHSNAVIAGCTALHLAAYYNQKDSLNVLLSLGANVNGTDCNGQIALTIAIVKRHLIIIKMLRNANSNIFQKDLSGRTPLSYCQNNDDIKKILMNPLLLPLMKLCKGAFKKELLAIDVLKSYIGIVGLLANEKCVNIVDFDGNYPLIEAIIFQQYQVVKLLLELGADPYLNNSFGINAFVFANWIKNHKIKDLLATFNVNQMKNESISFLKQECEKCYFNSYVLNLSKVPKAVNCLTQSGIQNRMKQFVNILWEEKSSEEASYGIKMGENVTDDFDENCVENAFLGTEEKKDGNDSKRIRSKYYLDCLWNSKLFTINIIAAAKHEKALRASNIFMINFYTNNAVFCSRININIYDSKYFKCIKLLYDSLSLLPNCNSKTFIGGHDDKIDRNKFEIGKELCCEKFVSSTFSLQNMIKSNYNNGTILMIQSKSGKNVSQYSSFSFDNEIIILPFTKFVVSNWYKCENLTAALQQSDKMQLLKKDEIKQYENNQHDIVIIELEEI